MKLVCVLYKLPIIPPYFWGGQFASVPGLGYADIHLLPLLSKRKQEEFLYFIHA